METLKVGIREFREKLARYVLETDVPVAITRHGDTIGYYIPARRKRSEAERTALKEVAVRLQQVLTAEGISEEEILDDFKQWRPGRGVEVYSWMPTSSYGPYWGGECGRFALLFDFPIWTEDQDFFGSDVYLDHGQS
jgi:PHD/YefM family antitoxin component YafN of YafNO toxin-antitoxin module